MSSQLRSVVLASGGSGGHVYPMLAFADCLRRHDADLLITCIGTERGLEGDLVPEAGFDLRMVPAHQFPRRPGVDLIKAVPRGIRAARAARAVMDDVEADVVVGFGGYVAAPAYTAAWRRRTPLVIHELNDPPGLANRLGLRLPHHLAVGFPHLPETVPALRNGTVTGVPLRTAITGLDRDASRVEAREKFGLDPDRPTLFVFGASQGAASINRAVAGAARTITDAGCQILHVVGARQEAEVTVPGDLAAPYVTVPFLREMERGYAAADLVLCRGGAMTLAEVTAVGLPAVYVPLPWGNREQYRNAGPVVDAGGGLFCDDDDLSAAWIGDTLLPLLTDPDATRRMGAAAANFGRTDGDEALRRFTLAALGHTGG